MAYACRDAWEWTLALVACLVALLTALRLAGWLAGRLAGAPYKPAPAGRLRFAWLFVLALYGLLLAFDGRYRDFPLGLFELPCAGYALVAWLDERPRAPAREALFLAAWPPVLAAVALASALALTATACQSGDTKADGQASATASAGDGVGDGKIKIPDDIKNKLKEHGIDIDKWKKGAWKNWNKDDWLREANDFINPIIKGLWDPNRMREANDPDGSVAAVDVDRRNWVGVAYGSCINAVSVVIEQMKFPPSARPERSLSLRVSVGADATRRNAR